MVRQEGRHVAVQGSLVENDHVIEALAANRPDDAFHVSALPWRSRRAERLFRSQSGHLPAELGSKDPVLVTEQILRRLVEGKCLPQLLRRPLRRRMGGHIEMDDPPPIVSQHQEHVQDLETNRRHGEEVDRHHGYISENALTEAAPGLRTDRRRSWTQPAVTTPIMMSAVSD